NHATANRFFSMFWGRQDVFAKRSIKGAYYPQCANLWKQVCPRQQKQKQLCENCESKSRRWHHRICSHGQTGFNAVLFQLGFIRCAVVTVPGKAIKLIDKNRLKLALHAIGNHALKFGTVIGCRA
ncbi:MAG: hypothetical protein LBD23_15120, partial [Oscillospiraceae bacterium]|nr:hypothetical protein [Oscillospiraceae bacterium]